MIACAVRPSHTISQDKVKPPMKMGWRTSYSTRSTCVSIERVKLTGCTIGYSVVRRSNPVSNDTVNAILKTKRVKGEVDLDAAGIEIVKTALERFRDNCA